MKKAKKIKKPKKITKAKLRSMARTAKRKEWKSVADQVRQRDGNVCCVCGQPHDKLNVHHLIPREIKEHWLEPMNLISLCPRHHKYSYTESFHKAPWWSFKWMQVNRPEQAKWVLDHINPVPQVPTEK
jgi:5-methylcytosine-specific restriction endonuclease McrA